MKYLDADGSILQLEEGDDEYNKCQCSICGKVANLIDICFEASYCSLECIEKENEKFFTKLKNYDKINM